MKKAIRLFAIFTIVFAIFAIGGTEVFGDSVSTDVRVQVNGVRLNPDVPPMIKNGYTLIPFRGVFESLGGEVAWDQENLIASVTYGDTEVRIPIGSKTAMVNGVSKTMQIPAEVINGRTLIPLRFVGESLGFTVDWNDAMRTAIVNSPDYSGGTAVVPVILGEISSMTVGKGSNARTENTVVTIQGTGSMTSGGEYTTLQLTEPNRFVIDIQNFSVAKGLSEQLYNQEDSPVSAVRVAQWNPETARVVIDLKEGSIPSVYLSSDGKTLKLTFKRLSTYFKPMEDGKLVVMLDPGHGAETGGKRSPDGSLREYEFNRSVANKIKGILEAQGIEVLLTVYDNTDTGLDERCRIANESNADIFVSIHANAFGNGEWNNANGWEIYHFEGATLAERLAKSIWEANRSKNDLKDRGVKTANFRVIKGTMMPAVLIEHGFYTNKTEVELLKSDEWRTKVAQCDAQGIINFLNGYL